MTRLHWGATCWLLCVLTFPAQILAAAKWPQPHSWVFNLISDLGVTECGIFDAGTSVERYICSPAHVLANASTVANGALLATGAILLWTAWPKRRTGQAAMALITTAGLLVMLVGFLPWDLYPDGHDAAALLQAAAQWAGMIVLVLALKGNTAAHWASALTIAITFISIGSFALFIDAISGGSSLAFGLGVTERVAFDILTLWSVVIGLTLLTTTLGRKDPTEGRRFALRSG